jgi:hypothetical protein
MIYKFKSKAAGDVIMLGPNGEQMLRLLGREPAPKGIIEPEAMPAAMHALQQAIAEAEARAAAAPPAEDAETDAEGETAVSLRRRLWPMLELLRRSAQAGEPVVWGV